MRFVTSLRNLSLSVATASFLLTGAALAASTNLTGVNARLDHLVNTKTARPGQVVEAKLDQPIKAANGLELPKGTQLIGKVDRVQASQDRGPATISLVFDKAELKNGQQVPVKATLLAAFPPNQDAAYSGFSVNPMGPAPKSVSDKEKVDQEPGALNHVAMRSSAQSHVSGTFSSKDGNFKLLPGTYLQIGVGPAQANSNMSRGAE